MCSDHFEPWSVRQGQSGFAWSWLGAALATTSLPFGAVNAPGQRYHPAVIAQAIATLDQMFPGRFWVALGSGQLMNEHITGGKWLRKELRSVPEDVLLDPATIARGLFRPEGVRRMIEEHRAGEDRSQRLWAMINLELWFRTCVDASPISHDAVPGL